MTYTGDWLVEASFLEEPTQTTNDAGSIPILVTSNARHERTLEWLGSAVKQEHQLNDSIPTFPMEE